MRIEESTCRMTDDSPVDGSSCAMDLIALGAVLAAQVDGLRRFGGADSRPSELRRNRWISKEAAFNALAPLLLDCGPRAEETGALD